MTTLPRRSWGRMSMCEDAASHEFLAHVGELRLRVRGNTIAEVLERAGLALTEVLLPIRPPPAPELVHEIVLQAPDRSALLIDWLNELLYLADRDRWVPTRIDIDHATETELRATARGPVLDQAPALVKAATWHGLRFEAGASGFEADVLLDV